MSEHPEEVEEKPAEPEQAEGAEGEVRAYTKMKYIHKIF